MKDLRIAIFTPSQNSYSETFIQAHKHNLKGVVFFYHGKGSAIELEGQKTVMTPVFQAGFKVIRMILRKPASFVTEHIVLASLKKNKVDVVLAEYGIHANRILPIIKKANLPLVVHFHGYDASVRRVLERCDHYKEVFGYAKKVIAVSRVMCQTLLDLGCPSEKVVHNTYGPRAEFHHVQCTFSKDQFVSVARFVDKKAPYYTILAFIEVLKSHPHATLVMGGEGVLINCCKNLVKLYRLEQTIIFCGVISSQAYIKLLEESLAFVQHSITTEAGDMEGTPLSILESSAAGLPVIATNHAGIPDVIVHEQTGLLCEEHDVLKMSQHMMRLLENKELAKTMGAEGKKRIKEQFSLSKHIAGLEKSLQEAVDCTH